MAKDVKFSNDPEVTNYDPNDYRWAYNVIGYALRIRGAINDSLGQSIDVAKKYHVGKHKITGRAAIFPVENNKS